MNNHTRTLKLISTLFLVYTGINILDITLDTSISNSPLTFISILCAVFLFFCSLHIMTSFILKPKLEDTAILLLGLYFVLSPLFNFFYFMRVLDNTNVLQELFFYLEFGIHPGTLFTNGSTFNLSSAYDKSPSLLTILRLWRISEFLMAIYFFYWLQQSHTEQVKNEAAPHSLFARIAVTSLLIYLAFFLFSWLINGEMLKRVSGDFLRISTSPMHIFNILSREKENQLISVHKVFKKQIGLNEEKVVHLIPMMHIAKKGFYADLLVGIPKNDSVVLIEGTSDKKRLLKNNISYAPLAKQLNLIAQEKHFDPYKLGYKVIQADVDLSDMSGVTLDAIHEFANKISEPKDYLTQWIGSLNNNLVDLRTNRTYVQALRVKYDMLDARNARLTKHLIEALVNHETVVIPWGALHMREMEQILYAQGFLKKLEKERILLDYNEILRLHQTTKTEKKENQNN